VTPDQLYAILRANPSMLSLVERRDPALHAAAGQGTSAGLRSLMMSRHLDEALPEATHRARLADLERRLAADPMDVEAQTLLEGEIQRKNIEVREREGE
jgi:hypothetical protein